MRFLLNILLLLFLILSGCSNQKPANKAEVEKEISSLIRPGLSMQLAKQRLGSAGFKCHFRKRDKDLIKTNAIECYRDEKKVFLASCWHHIVLFRTPDKTKLRRYEVSRTHCVGM